MHMYNILKYIVILYSYIAADYRPMLYHLAMQHCGTTTKYVFKIYHPVKYSNPVNRGTQHPHILWL